MSAIFIKIFNLGVTAGWIVLAVLLLRPLLRRAPKWINCLLWGIVGLRLIFPFSLESVFSLIPSAEPLPENIMMTPTPEINSGIGVINNAVNPIISDSLTPGIGTSINPMQLVVAIASVVWVIGIALILIYGVVSYIRLALRVRVSVKHRDNIYFCDEVDSPFILGMLRPRIYLPSGMCGEEMEYVIEHEDAHLKRRDHLWTPLAFVILAVYWFNPLIWVAYVMLCRDIEMACDEKVVKKMDPEAKKGYSEALLSCSVHRRRIMACPLAFGEVGVKERIKSVLNYKKPAFWIIIVALVATVIVSVCFLTNPHTMVREMLEPGSEWVARDDAMVSFYVDDDYNIRGYLSFYSQYYDIEIHYSSAGLVRGTMFYIEIYKGALYDAELREDDLLLAGVLKPRNGNLVFTVDKDNLGLLYNTLTFEKTDAEHLLDSNGRPVTSSQTLAMNNDLYIYIDGYGCEKSGVEIEFKQALRQGEDILFLIEWTAKTENGCNIGPYFTVSLYLNNVPVKIYDKGTWEEYSEAMAGSGTTVSTYNITEHYNISEPGKYRFECNGAWVDFEVVKKSKEETSSQNEVNNAQPVFDTSYSFYDSSRKYDVYVWQMAKHSFSFGLLKSKVRTSFDNELLSLKGVRASEMRQILLEKNLGPNDVNIVPWQNPVSSYIGDFWISSPYVYDGEPLQNFYLAIIYDMLFGSSPRRYYPSGTETEWFDIDGDGEKEYNMLRLGLKDGKFMFNYSISENGKSTSYYDTFYTAPMNLKFFTSEGEVRLRGVDESGGVHIYDIVFEDGHVKLVEIKSVASVVDSSQKELDISKIDLSLVDRIVITNGQTGAVKYMNSAFDRDGFNNMMALFKTVKATDPVSNRGYYGFTYHVELYYDYQTIFSFSLYSDKSEGARIICGYYETAGGFDYPCRYKLTSPSYENLEKALGKYFQ